MSDDAAVLPELMLAKVTEAAGHIQLQFKQRLQASCISITPQMPAASSGSSENPGHTWQSGCWARTCFLTCMVAKTPSFWPTANLLDCWKYTSRASTTGLHLMPVATMQGHRVQKILRHIRFLRPMRLDYESWTSSLLSNWRAA